MQTCFVCLEACNTRVCSTCKCYAHSKCWGKYVQSRAKSHTVVTADKVILFTPWSAECPQCRGRIVNVKPVTRSDTDLGRYMVIALDYYSFLAALEEIECDDVEGRFTLYSTLLSAMIKHKAIIRSDDDITCILKNELRVMYKQDNWAAANLYHMQLFGTQID